MKIAPVLAVLSLGLLLGACNSLDNPLSAIPNTGRDARVLNTNTGSYEWPNTTPTPKPQAKPADVPPAIKATPTPANNLDAQKGNVAKADTPKATPQKAKATPRVVAAKATPTPRPRKETGVLNLETGKIEWSQSPKPGPGKPAPPPAEEAQATPAPSVPAPAPALASPAGPLLPE